MAEDEAPHRAAALIPLAARPRRWPARASRAVRAGCRPCDGYLTSNASSAAFARVNSLVRSPSSASSSTSRERNPFHSSSLLFRWRVGQSRLRSSFLSTLYRVNKRLRGYPDCCRRSSHEPHSSLSDFGSIHRLCCSDSLPADPATAISQRLSARRGIEQGRRAGGRPGHRFRRQRRDPVDRFGIVHHPFTMDPNLVNPWGTAESSGSPIWVSDNARGVSTLYTIGAD